jgi:hypothetical protein
MLEIEILGFETPFPLTIEENSAFKMWFSHLSPIFLTVFLYSILTVSSTKFSKRDVCENGSQYDLNRNYSTIDCPPKFNVDSGGVCQAANDAEAYCSGFCELSE